MQSGPLAGQEPHEILAAAASHVRVLIPDGHVRVDPDGQPAPLALSTITHALGDAATGKVVSCPRFRSEVRCRTAPEARAQVRFDSLEVSSSDVASVDLTIYEFPPDPRIRDLAVLHQVLRLTLTLVDGVWKVTDVETLLES